MHLHLRNDQLIAILKLFGQSLCLLFGLTAVLIPFIHIFFVGRLMIKKNIYDKI